jgi:hypothetical protein
VSPPHPDLPTSIRNEDLVDFLLTRFDEDEEAARFVALSASRSNASLVAHVLRDVRAKRDLVCYFRDLEQRGPRGATMERALRLIGQTYADHPHYREEWRP